MSRAFTKEDESGGPPLVPPRAPLPPDTPNYVTPRGLAALRHELAALLEERGALEIDEPAGERTRLAAGLTQRIAELEARLASAVLVEPSTEQRDEVRFGAEVSLRSSSGKQRTIRIVGVDEADAAAGRIAFIAPLARALLGKRAGDAALVRTPQGEDEVEILAIGYDPT
ncbi:MAG TPA: GreA/GreB family elongation factor [Polyangiaceae bacterium]